MQEQLYKVTLALRGARRVARGCAMQLSSRKVRAHAAHRYGVNAKLYFEDYLPGPKRTVFHTRKGLSWRTAWGVLRYSANNAFIAFVHAAQMKEQARALRTLSCNWSLACCMPMTCSVDG